ncbi:MAG TPA: glycoside hydrolase family 57 protein [Candidatus Omnitrophota bacterium]|nr:glycoside hydrolase family 57 protein [Candidatus Omnitrophota bacterium]HPT39819.1 glycoside hydrolase family 57 protein [Candidatus Omnitrophota bacterium]
MLNLAIIYHMHQPYYKNLLTQESDLPWVRLHGVKDYLDMVQILEKFPEMKLTFNVVPSLFEQVEDYNRGEIKDKFFQLSAKPADKLTKSDKEFILANFFSINPDKVISFSPRYYQLYYNKRSGREFSLADYLDLQVCFNLNWIDPSFRRNIPELKKVADKERFFSESDKQIVLAQQLEILKGIIPAYKLAQANQQIEISVTPYYHPILPLLCDTKIAKEANKKTALPKEGFRYPRDAKYQIDSAVEFYKQRFATAPLGMWPSEEGVSEHIVPYIIDAGIKWIVTDEAILFKSLKLKKRDTKLLYQPHLLKRKSGDLNIVFRDRNLSDLIGFVYHQMKEEDAVNNFMGHLENIHKAFKNKDILVTIALDGENAWEFFRNDGHDFLELFYQRISQSDFVKTTTVSEYLKLHPAQNNIKRLSAGSWIYGEFGKWIGNPYKVKAWEWLAHARKAMQETKNPSPLAWKQMYILEGSDWFWWAGEDPDGSFDRLFRLHLTNFYQLIKKTPPAYLDKPLVA